VTKELPAATLLLVEDNEATQRALRRLLELRAEVVAARTVFEARRLSDRVAALAGVVADERLPDGSGLEVALALRRRDPTLPILVMTGELDHGLLRKVQLAGVEFVLKPVQTANLYAFVDRCLARADPIVPFARRYGLSERETEVVRHVCAGRPLKQLADALGVKHTTARSYFERIRRKTGIRAMADLPREVERQRATPPPEDSDAPPTSRR